jgi:hypothetical protein
MFLAGEAEVAKALEELDEAVARDDSAAKIKHDVEQAVEHDNEVRKDDNG